MHAAARAVDVTWDPTSWDNMDGDGGDGGVRLRGRQRLRAQWAGTTAADGGTTSATDPSQGCIQCWRGATHTAALGGTAVRLLPTATSTERTVPVLSCLLFLLFLLFFLLLLLHLLFLAVAVHATVVTVVTGAGGSSAATGSRPGWGV